jgi:hypothetical protein
MYPSVHTFADWSIEVLGMYTRCGIEYAAEQLAYFLTGDIFALMTLTDVPQEVRRKRTASAEQPDAGVGLAVAQIA